MIKILKRNGSIADFDVNKIITAIQLSMSETKASVDKSLAETIAHRTEEKLHTHANPVSVEIIQDLVEESLMDSPRKDAAKRYNTKSCSL
ncbi:ATP cone domain-containing protein, partial [Vallitalea guaymasensis]|uniref:ATP cone domain-containing protein n=1 Tax=Vallitalea guaymasensis TaxID=1185412 RepID=UPI00272C2DA4